MLARAGARGVAIALALWLAALVACGFVAWHARYTADLSAFLPRRAEPAQRLLIDQLRDGVSSRLLLIGVAGASEEQLAAASRALAAKLRAQDAFSYVQNGEAQAIDGERAWLFEHRYVLSDAVVPGHFSVAALGQSLRRYEDLLNSNLSLVAKRVLPADPSGEILHLVERLEGANAPHSRHGVWFTQRGDEALLIAQTRAGGFDTEAQGQALAIVERAWTEARRDTGAAAATIEIAGPGVYAVASRARIQGDARRLSLLATVLVALLLLLAFRNPRVLVLGLLPVISGALVGVGAVAIVFGQVHGITLGFGVTIIGEAVDYGIYYFAALAAATGSFTPPQRTQRAMALERLWPTLRLGTLTSICGFSAMLFSGFDGLSQLGVFSVAGLSAAYAVTRFVLPALTPLHIALPTFATDGVRIARLARALPAGRTAVVLAALIACAFLAFRHDRLWEQDLARLNPISESEKARDVRLRADLGAPDVRGVLVARGATADAALDAAEALAPVLDAWVAEGIIDGFDTPTFYLPSARTQRIRQGALPAPEELRSNLMTALRETAFAPDVFTPFLDAVEQARTAPPLSRDALTGTAFALKADALIVRDGEGWAALIVLRGISALSAIEAHARDLDPAHYLWLDFKATSNALLTHYRGGILLYSGLGALAILALLSWQLASLERALRIGLPLAAAVLVTAALVACVAPLSLFHLVALLLVVGIGSNYALFFDRAHHGAVESESPALTLTLCCATTFIAFGLLSVSATPVLRAIGGVVALGVVLSLVFSALAIPRAPQSAVPARIDSAGSGAER
ncbi:MAG: MMPL family transporter [Casimicrobiaceae bacterium]